MKNLFLYSIHLQVFFMNSYITRKKVDFMPEINYKIENEIKKSRQQFRRRRKSCFTFSLTPILLDFFGHEL